MKNVTSPMVNILLRRQLWQNHLILNLAMIKSRFLTWRNKLLRQVKSYIQEVVYHTLPELKLRRIFPSMYFVNTKQ